jgi:phosphate transport system protein
VDREEVELEEECLKVLALHQPFAIDLRFIVTVVKVNNDLERVGDLAQNIAERAIALSELPQLGVPLEFERMAEGTRKMVRDALDSLVKQDTDLARQVIDADDEIDQIHEQMFSDLQELMRSDPDRITRAVHTISASRNLERIADLATNIAENVIFLVDGDVIRHGRVLGE